MQKFVLDCSATMAYFFKDETSTYVDSAIESLGADGIAYVPPNWSQEIVNTSLSAIRRKRVTEQEVKRIYKILNTLPIQLMSHIDLRVLDEIHNIANLYELTAYDAAYLQLAINKNLPLVTLDQHFKRMAQKAGVKLWSQTRV